MDLKPGVKLASPASSAQFIVIRGAGDQDLACAGAPLGAGATPGEGDGDDLLVGKRYCDEGDTVELLCTASGTGPLTLAGAAMTEKAAKSLPSSD